MKKYAFYCSGGASRIIKFYNSYSENEFPVSFVFYDGERHDIIEILKLLFIEKLVLISDDRLKDYTTISTKLLTLLQNENIDFLFCFGDKILKTPLIDIYKNRIINFHPSLLPAFPGLNAIDKALNSSVQILGNTAHFIDDGIDTGPIIMQSVITRKVYTCYEDVLSMQIFMLKTIWKLLDNDKITVINNRVDINHTIKCENFYSI